MKGLGKTDCHIWPKIAVFDIEAKNWTDVYIVGHVDEYGNRKAFKTIKGYLKWLFWKFPSDIVWAHYGGKYDVRFVIAEICKKHGSWKTFESGGMLVITNVFDPETRRTIKFCDSSRLIVGSVKKIGKMVDLPKLEIDRTKMGTHTLDLEIDYCIRDCEIVLKGLQKLRDTTLSVGCDFAFTLPSMMSRYVRKSDVLDFTKFVELSDLSTEKHEFQIADQFCESAYFGGRVEVFRRGKFHYPLYYYDIRSSYPHSMTKELPAYFKEFVTAPKRTDEKTLRKYLSYSGVTECSIYIKPGTQYIPVLPVVYKGKLVFPEGKFYGRWTNIELLAALDRGAKIMPVVQARYSSRPWLRKFIETFFSLRQKAIDEKDDVRAYTYKIALNSLYGKLAENVTRSHMIFGDWEYSQAVSHYGIENIYPRPEVPGIYEVKLETRGPFRHVAAGAYVTAYSRLLLVHYLEWAISHGGRVYYSDTDSLVTDIRLPIMPDLLGNLKLEETFLEAEFLAPKVYRGKLCNKKEIGQIELCSGKDMYKVKGTPISSIDNESRTQLESYHRWLAYKEKVHPEKLDLNQLYDLEWIRTKNKWTHRYLTAKEGITGFREDIKKGRIDPQPRLLIREMKQKDTKRQHGNQDSQPILLENYKPVEKNAKDIINLFNTVKNKAANE